MRYLPLSDADRTRDAGHRRRRLDRRPVRRTSRRPRRLPGPVDLPRQASEPEVERALGAWAARNRAAGAGPFFCGAGAYRHHVPASVDHLIQRSEFLTSYTPYQPEIAQGTLQVLFEFQTQVAALTGMEVANASMYDGSTACAEAVMMAARVTRRPQGGAVRRTASPLCRQRLRPWPIVAGVETRAPARRPSTPRPAVIGGDRRRHRLRRGADPERLRNGHRRLRRSPRPPTPPARC